MELRHLRYFVAVAEQRHFGRAAERLHMAQPPLSQQIRQLETELGFALLSRTTRRVDLTPAGVVFLDRAREVLVQVDEATHEAGRVAAGRVGRLTVGCVGSATYSLLPDLARGLLRELPEVDLDFRGEMLSPDQAAAVREGTLDLALMRPVPDMSGLEVTPVRQDRLLVALPRDHRLARRRRLRTDELHGEDLVVHAGEGRSAMNAVVHDLLGGVDVRPGAVHEVSESSTLVTFVAAGLGIAVVPAPTAALAVPGVAYVDLTGGAGIDLVAVSRTGAGNPVLAHALRLLAELTSP